MIDTHAHIDFDLFDEDRQEMIARARENGVESIIIPSVEPKNFDKVRNTARSDNMIFYGVGVHPHNAGEADDKVLDDIRKRAEEDKVVAIGEIGLDYYYDFTPKDVQHDIYRKQLKIAKELDLPVIVHNREADEDIMRITEEEQDGSLRGVFHCFSSGVDTMKKAMELGFNISFTGNITFKKVDLDDVIREVPLDRVMIETDSPFMTPVPNRGKRNEPSYVGLVAKKIAEVRSLSIDEVFKMTTENAKKMFRLALILSIMLIGANGAFAQTDDEYYDDDYYEDEYYEEQDNVELVHPYPKRIGIGFLAGSNTIVETFELEAGDKPVSYEGLFSWAGTVKVGILDFLLLDLTYQHTQNSTIAEDFNRDRDPETFPDPIDPYTYQAFEFSTIWIANPYSRVNVYGLAGVSYLRNTIVYDTYDLFGLNTGIGFFINIPFDFGLLTLNAEWKLTFQMNENDAYNPDIPVEELDLQNDIVTSTNFYSVPRFGIVFFPNIGW